MAPGGVLAVQMPNNFGEPSHKLLRAIAEQGPWADRLALPVTTGDSYTVTMAIEAIRAAAAEMDIAMREAVVAVVGAVGLGVIGIGYSTVQGDDD